VILSALLLQIIDNWYEILQNHFSFGTVLAAMFLAFATGLEIDQDSFLRDFKLWILGSDIVAHEEATWENCQRSYHDNRVEPSPESSTSKRPKREMNFFRRIFSKRGPKRMGKSKRVRTFTSLNRRMAKVSKRNENNATRNKAFMKSLARFSKKHMAQPQDVKEPEMPTETVTESTLSQESAMSDISMGQTSIRKAQAVSLLEDVPTPLCCIRGLDLFQTEDPDPDMISHPFLIEYVHALAVDIPLFLCEITASSHSVSCLRTIRNGLRDYPTFMINIMTAYGNICVYFKLPAWIKDWEKSLVENDGDPSDVVALKRFLKGDEQYKIKCFKIMPELVAGPLPVRLLAPHNTEFPLDFQGFISTTYAKEPATNRHCPVMCLTLDLISNPTMRGFVGIFKRNMKHMTVDFACVLHSGEDDDPSGILGLWRMDHLLAEDYPRLPDRYSLEEEDSVNADSIRGSLLMKRMSQTQTQLSANMIEVVAETEL
jgi:hypothetical protein